MRWFPILIVIFVTQIEVKREKENKLQLRCLILPSFLCSSRSKTFTFTSPYFSSMFVVSLPFGCAVSADRIEFFIV